jgi:hypothetical protein
LLVNSPIIRNKTGLTAILIVRYWHEFVCSVRLEQHTNESRAVERSQDTKYAAPTSFILTQSHPSRPIAFTRVLTTLYSTTLLSLLTVLQLTLLARAKYIHSIVQLERDERLRERLEAQFTLGNMLFGSHAGLQEFLEEGGIDGEAEARVEGGEPMSEEVESRFLTMSWWILHVGWKGVGERVRRGVEEAFDGLVSLLQPFNID